MNQERGGKQDTVSDVAKVLVAVKVAKEIPRTALAWALTHVAQPGDSITLLALHCAHAPGETCSCSCSCNTSRLHFIPKLLECLNSSYFSFLALVKSIHCIGLLSFVRLDEGEGHCRNFSCVSNTDGDGFAA